jgi:hypothetical protein
LELSGKKQIKNLSIEDKIMARMFFTQKRSSDAQDDFSKTSNSIANVSRTIKGNTNNILTSSGKILSDVFGIQAWMVIIREVLQSIDILFSGLAIATNKIGQAWEATAAAIELAFSTTKALIAVLPKLGMMYRDPADVAEKEAKLLDKRKEFVKKLAAVNVEIRLAQKNGSVHAEKMWESVRKVVLAVGKLNGYEEAFGKDTLKKTEDSMKKLVKLSSRLSDNITDIAKMAQEAAFKTTIFSDKENSLLNNAVNNTISPSRSAADNKETLATEETAEESNRLLSELVTVTKKQRLYA